MNWLFLVLSCGMIFEPEVTIRVTLTFYIFLLKTQSVVYLTSYIYVKNWKGCFTERLIL